MTRFSKLTMTTAMLAVLAVPAYAGEMTVTTPTAPIAPTAPIVATVTAPAVKGAVVETATGAITDKIVTPGDVKTEIDATGKLDDGKKVDAIKHDVVKTETVKTETVKTHEDKTGVKHPDEVKKHDKKIESVVPGIEKH